MELEEMKSLWEQMSAGIEKQKTITDSLVLQMTKARYRDKVNKIIIPEAAGTVICLACVVSVSLNFTKLGTWYLLVCGIVSVLILLVLPALSIKSVYDMQSVNISHNNYKQSLLQSLKSKMQFVFFQKISFYLGAILLLTLLPVAGAIMGGKDPFKTSMLWLLYTIIFPFFYGFAQWVFKRYKKTVLDAENILKELED